MKILDKSVKFTNVEFDKFFFNGEIRDYIKIKKQIWKKTEFVQGDFVYKPSREYEFQFYFDENEDAMQFQMLVNCLDKCDLINCYEHNNRVFVMTKNEFFLEIFGD
ncbi:hypothetical protein [Sphingorhabdus sp.]|uniref:hypothetical protein n=1 Tax=Sphingorhabdus sp. TaxID=1902408 RepID=UPI0038FC7871